ncbi:hypothetical protein C0R09_07145 [Brevibacillus laterosporus]|uniref:glycoside hydrolase family 78 protein n=1 Tax=Brevibacillus laterosporus TaxID=1465 RepID=UPI000C78CD70|nr:hypothetical protein [Brevibacillus laterosporus]AUM64327.1 hypothetical protein C0R09_07145 [Brevibacillus laterosporus]
MDSKITIPYKWSFYDDNQGINHSRIQEAIIKKGDLIIGCIRSSSSDEELEITSSIPTGISLIKSISYNTAGSNNPDSISTLVYQATTDMTATLTFRARRYPNNINFSVAAIFRNAELVAINNNNSNDSNDRGTPDQILPTNRSNGMGVLLVNRYTPNEKTEKYTKILETIRDSGPTMLTLDNVRKQDAMPPSISHSGGLYSAIIAILLAPALIGPDKPTNLSPSGSSSSPAMVGSNPTFAWSYSSPDVGSVQKAYQLVIKKKIDNSLLRDTGKVASGSSTHKTPVYFLAPDTEYYYTVKVWDQYDNASPESDRQYIKAYKAPIATPVSPLGSEDKPGGASLAPTLKWEYYDPQGIEKYAFEIRIVRKSDNSLVKAPALVISSQSQYDMPLGELKAGELYAWTVRVISEEHIGSVHTPIQYFITNTPPSAPTLTLPVNTHRTSTNPIFEAIAGSDPENDKQSFVIRIASDEQFTQDIRYYNSEFNYKNWSYHDGHEWQPFEDYKLSNDIVKGKKIRFDMRDSEPLLKNKTYYWSMAGADGATGAFGSWSTTQSIRVGNVLQFQLKEPIMDKVEAHRLVMNAVYKIANDGANPARLLVEVSNNAFDDSPTWEDMTQAFLNRDYLELQNRLKQADKWGLNVRITVFANDSLGPIEFDAFGFSYD